MNQSIFEGSFLGFFYNNVHSSELGIFRTMEGEGQQENLLPTIQNKTITLNNQDGQIYYGDSRFEKTINISYAFEGLSSEKLRRMKQLFSDKKVHDLILDEYPYKRYSAKVTSQANIKYICFEENGVDYYNGEGSLTFTCYYPYARGIYPCVEDYLGLQSEIEYLDENSSTEEIYGDLIVSSEEETEDVNATIDFEKIAIHQKLQQIAEKNYLEWSFLLPSRSKVVGTFLQEEDEQGQIYWKYDVNNVGEIEIPFQIIYSLPTTGLLSFKIVLDDKEIKVENISPPSGEDVEYALFDTGQSCIYQLTSQEEKTGLLYNENIIKQDFFSIPTGEHSIKFYGTQPIKIRYNYLFY